jgi:hypothetical protein
MYGAENLVLTMQNAFFGVVCGGALWCLLGKQANDLLWTFLTDDWG